MDFREEIEGGRERIRDMKERDVRLAQLISRVVGVGELLGN